MNTNYNLLKNKEIIAILDGDFQIEEVDGIRIAMPYLSGPMLWELSQKFGCYQEYYWGNSSKTNLSRWQYMDKRINKLLSGLENIVQSIAEMRNNRSDSHGLGSKKVNIPNYHARLALNSSSIMAEFILSVSQHSR